MVGTTRCRWCHELIDEGDAGHRCRAEAAALASTIALGGDRTIAVPGSHVTPHDDADDGFPAVDDLIDQPLGQYELKALVGRGSMGRVYQARHLGLQRDCAIKVMNPGLVTRQPQIRERFWAEARAVANLLHPHVVTVHNLGSERGYHFIEMEFVPGGVSLLESLIREGPFDPVRASTLVREVVLALGAAHRADLVHRDVKPSNVLLTADNRAKLADFGLVRHLGELDNDGGPIAGTPTFMAPELFAGVPASPRSDLYAVGVMYYFLLSGRLPFTSDQLSRLIHLHQSEPVPEIRQVRPEVPEFVATILQRCLAKAPAERYASAHELASDLQSSIVQLRDTESLVRESLEGLDCFVQGGKDHHRVLFPLPNDRMQEVYIEVAHGPQGERLLSVFSVCGEVDPKHFEYALKLNDSLTYGSLSIRNVNGQPMFVMTRTFARDHVCAADIRAALLEIAPRGDRVEQQFSDADLY